jgi:hypothetical protein
VTPRSGRALLWAALTTVAYGLAVSLASFLMNGAHALSPVVGGALYIALYGAIVGLVVAFLQLLVLPRVESRVIRWLAAGAVGGAIGFVGLAFVGEILGNAIDPLISVVIGEGTIQIASGAVLGLVAGLAQSLALPQILPRRRWWLVATGLGAGLAYGMAALLLEQFEIAALRGNLILSFSVTIGLFVGVGQAVAIATSRHRPASA